MFLPWKEEWAYVVTMLCVCVCVCVCVVLIFIFWNNRPIFMETIMNIIGYDPIDSRDFFIFYSQ
jgi:hypothetical protein